MINGIYINKANENLQALFGYLHTGSEIKNLGLSNTEIIANKDVAGLVGENHGNIINCFNNGLINGNENTGGLVGSNYSTISKCYSSGTIYGYYHTGGLVGWNENASISNCYSTASVTGGSFTGGLAGSIYLCEITNSYSKGFVIATTYSGGLLGGVSNSDDVVLNSFWDIETSGYTTSGGGTGKTSAEMKTITTFTEAGWNFTQIWNINSNQNEGYPYLIESNSVSTDDMQISVPSQKMRLSHAYPNPFNPSTTISFELSDNDHILIDIYNAKGQKIKELVNRVYDPGEYSVVWDGKSDDYNDCGSGIYFYSMKGKNAVLTKKMILIK